MMESIKSKIIQYLEDKQVSTEEIADILGKTGVIKGVYPIGEGAGYAGGIVSSAVDGIKLFEKIIEKFYQFITEKAEHE